MTLNAKREATTEEILLCFCSRKSIKILTHRFCALISAYMSRIKVLSLRDESGRHFGKNFEISLFHEEMLVIR